MAAYFGRCRPCRLKHGTFLQHDTQQGPVQAFQRGVNTTHEQGCAAELLSTYYVDYFMCPAFIHHGDLCTPLRQAASKVHSECVMVQVACQGPPCHALWGRGTYPCDGHPSEAALPELWKRVHCIMNTRACSKCVLQCPCAYKSFAAHRELCYHCSDNVQRARL